MEPILKLAYQGDRLVRGVVFGAKDRSVATFEFNVLAPADPDAEKPAEAPPCESCKGRGWGIFNGNEVQACDCGKYKSDEEAVAALEAALAADHGGR
jgi:hypothetical protein